MRLAAFGITLSVAGCAAPGYWLHPEHQDQARFQRDAAQCVYESNLATANAPASIFLSQQLAQDVATGVRQGELQRLCMQARGYYWQTGAPAASPIVAGHAVKPASAPAPYPTVAPVNRSGAQRVAVNAKCTASWDAPVYFNGAFANIEFVGVRCDDGQIAQYRCVDGICQPKE